MSHEHKHKWEYPIISSYHTAMAALYASEHNIRYWLERATKWSDPYSGRQIQLLKHNIDLLVEAQANAISWASRA